LREEGQFEKFLKMGNISPSHHKPRAFNKELLYINTVRDRQLVKETQTEINLPYSSFDRKSRYVS
jgi:hypothetical protein